VTDHWRKTCFSSTYSYHHGYFDGIEREFHGFGRVEQVDVESYGKFEQCNTDSPYITQDKPLYQPPVKTVTWYHTGALLERERILSQFENEYFPHDLKEKYPGKVKILGDFEENALPPPDLAAEDLSADESREALRACKGMMLRQEVYELEVDALERGEHRPVKLFTTAYHNCHIRSLQPKAQNPHAVFLVTESEAITYHYELDITEAKLSELRPDPRITHTLNLKFDEYANVLQSVAVVYPRREEFQDDTLKLDEVTLIQNVQKERHLAYSEAVYTKDVVPEMVGGVAKNEDTHRLRAPCEVITHELTGIKPAGEYFSLQELHAYQLSPRYQPDPGLKPIAEIAYHQLADNKSLQKRQVEHSRTLFFKDDLSGPLPFTELGRLGLTYEGYTLALTNELLDAVYKEPAGKHKLDQAVDGATTARDKLNNPTVSGYLSGPVLAGRFKDLDTTGQYWIRSGIAGFASDAAQRFYLPERYTDPFGDVTTLEYDPRDLFITSSTDAMSNTTRVTHFDFRVLAPREMKDINDNLYEVYFDVLGLPTAMAVKGKGTEGDSLTGFTDALANPTLANLTNFFDQADLDGCN
jgi:YD repeat-containing protein